jgi:hypothetical protein
VCKAGRGLVFERFLKIAVPRRQFGTTLVELPLEFGHHLLGIARRGVERRGHAPASHRRSLEI